jgi:hypothetical protein
MNKSADRVFRIKSYYSCTQRRGKPVWSIAKKDIFDSEKQYTKALKRQKKQLERSIERSKKTANTNWQGKLEAEEFINGQWMRVECYPEPGKSEKEEQEKQQREEEREKQRLARKEKWLNIAQEAEKERRRREGLESEE